MIRPASAVAERRAPYGAPPGLGPRGEEAAARHLESLGFRILERRFRTKAGEIDLVAEEGGALVFVEVKSRSSLGFGRPSEAVDGRKQARLRRAAEAYLQRCSALERPCRFDVVEVLRLPGGELCCHLIRDAFDAS